MICGLPCVGKYGCLRGKRNAWVRSAQRLWLGRPCQGNGKEKLMRQMDVIRRLLGDACRRHDVLLSSRTLSKNGLSIWSRFSVKLYQITSPGSLSRT